MASKHGGAETDPGGTETEQTSTSDTHQKDDLTESIRSTSDVSKDNALQDNLTTIGLEQRQIEFIIEHGEKFIEKPIAVLAAKLKIPKEKAKLAIEALKSFKQQQQKTKSIPISQNDIELIETCLKENPEVDDPEDIALICEIEVSTVKAYFESLPLNDNQKAAIKDKLNVGNSVSDIANILKLPERKVRDYIENTFITFHGAEGEIMLGIIQKNFPEIQFSKLREMILSRDVKLLDKLCCILPKRNVEEYDELKRYFGRFEESKPFFEVEFDLTFESITLIKEKLNSGYLPDDIANILQLPDTIVRNYIESTFITFHGVEGEKMFGIIQKNFPEIQCSKLREMILSRDLKLQDKLCCILQKQNIDMYKELKVYFERFEESKSFFRINFELSIEDIFLIRGKSLSDIEQLSKQLNKVETIIKDYLVQYHPNLDEQEFNRNLQIDQIRKILNFFGNDGITFHMYRMIISNSFKTIIHNAGLGEQAPKNILQDLLPLAFYYLKCSLPLDDITQVIANTTKITLTTHDLFHILFQLSEPVLRGYCIEHYSFSNPVPLYYPNLKGKFEVCTELWYSLQEFNGLISFGLGRASSDQIGKSYLLDFIFGTDFVRGSPQTSAFHLNSIDIQMTKNLFGEIDKKSDESTRWAYIDCHGHSNSPVIKAICQQLDVALIHASYLDYSINRTTLSHDIDRLTKPVKHVYLLIRDSEGDEVRVEKQKGIANQKLKIVFIPKLTKPETNIHSVKKKLKEIGYEILHLEYENPKYINSEFLERLLESFDLISLKEIQFEKRLISKIADYIRRVAKSPHTIGFEFLNYYPIFVDYMSYYYKASFETNQKIVDEYSSVAEKLARKLNSTRMGNVVVYFNEILKKGNSALFLWKLSQVLFLLSKQINRTVPKNAVEQKNDKYTLEILWREALLSCKFDNFLDTEENKFSSSYATNFSHHVERGEVFELIDGDNLRFFNKDIDSLLSELYDKQLRELQQINEGKSIKMKQAPIVVSIFGPQSSGKSTLLNYCFGCKFLTSAGRCTRGIYGSLSRLSRPVNLSNHFLILDTEGLDAIERGNIKDTSQIHFDRTMVLFCLAVSQVVIINVKGDIGTEMQNLLQVCAHSLNKLKVRRVPAPKIFFVLNQQADPDPKKHLDSIHILLEKLNEKSELLDTGGLKISELIQVSIENLFILPSAFNSQQMNEPGANIFDSNVIKLSPTNTFADKCAELRMSIINQLDAMPVEERASFKTMSEWMEMSGTVWDTIIRYQDIVKYRNVEEEMCSNMLRALTPELMNKHIHSYKQKFNETTEDLTLKINAITIRTHPNIVLSDIMSNFDDVFNEYQDRCLKEYDNTCQSDSLLRKMNHICGESRSNLSRFIFMERKIYEDKFKFQIKAVLSEIELSENMKKFKERIDNNVDTYLNMNIQEQKLAFEEIWKECFACDSPIDKQRERDETFDNLYSIFRVESTSMQNKPTIYELFRNYKFNIVDVISFLIRNIITRFESDPVTTRDTEQTNQFIYPCCENNLPIKDMTPYPGSNDYEFFGKKSLYVVNIETGLWAHKKEIMKANDWVPVKCLPLVKYCSGYYTHPDIHWKDLNHQSQVLLLASKLKVPDNLIASSWKKLMTMISNKIRFLIKKDPNISPGTVKEMVNCLCSMFKHVNYEISYFGAKLTITAERTISTYVLALAYKSLLDVITNVPLENRAKMQVKKTSNIQYSLQKVENRKMFHGTWDRAKMKESDSNFANKFARDFLECVKRGLKTAEQPIIEDKFTIHKELLSHEGIFFLANSKLTTELHKDPEKEVVDEGNFVVQYICNRNEEFKTIFLDEWLIVEDEIYNATVREMNTKFIIQNETVIQVLKTLQDSFKDKCSGGKEGTVFDSDSNFEVADTESCKSGADFLLKAKESPFKAMLLYLQMYLDPMVSPGEFNKLFYNTFEVEGVQVKTTDSNVLCDKPVNPAYFFDQNLFKKLENTNMFNNENIFNIYEYIRNFISVLETYEYELPRDEFREMVQDLKEEFEKNALGCPSQCPSCGKLCERELHPNDGKCQIKTGHQICSMGGQVWKNDDDKTAVLFMCDDYKEDALVNLSGQNMNWEKFKDQCGKDWDWDLPKEDNYLALQHENREKMRTIWNKYGKGILNYYSTKGTKITYVPYTTRDELTVSLMSDKYCICFVIDGTSSMFTEINKVRISVGQFISKYKEYESTFFVIVYRDHCDKKITEIFPTDRRFTPQYKSIQQFLETVKAYGGGDYPEAVLDGLATATTKCEWTNSLNVKNIIVHLFDAPPHGDFPNYGSHSAKSNKKHCCCCNHGTLCLYDWKIDVWDKMKEFNIQYHGINTGETFPAFEAAMKQNLGDLCGEFQFVGKEVVNDAILRIFIGNNFHL